MAVRNTQTLIQALSKPLIVYSSQTVLQVLRRQGALEAAADIDDSMAAPPEPTPWVEPTLPQPVTSIGNLTQRIQRLMHDLTETCFSEAEVRAQLFAEVERLARQHLFGDMIWMQAVAGKATYDLEDAGILIATSRANSTPAAPADMVTLNDVNQAFVTAGVQVGDRVRNLTNGCLATVTSVESETEIICSGGFFNPQTQLYVANEDGDDFVIERPVLSHQILGIRQVIYNGHTLSWYRREQFDRLHETLPIRPGVPRYWSTDTTERPTQLRVFPAPSASGASWPLAPMSPHALVPHANFIILAWVSPHPTQDSQLASDESWLERVAHQSDPTQLLQVPRAFHTPLVYRAAANLLQSEGPCQNLPVAKVCEAMAQMFLQLLGVD